MGGERQSFRAMQGPKVRALKTRGASPLGGLRLGGQGSSGQRAKSVKSAPSPPRERASPLF